MESIILKSKGAEERREKTRGGGAMLVKSKEERKKKWTVEDRYNGWVRSYV